MTAERSRVAVRVTADAARHVRAGHPWLFDQSITTVSGADTAAPGDLAVVFDPQRRFAGIGLWDPASHIRVRMLHGGPPVTIDEPWWRTHLASALQRREPLAQSGTTTGYRLVHGENDGFGGLVVDRYDTTLVLKVYTAAWLPHLDTIVGNLADLTRCERVALRLARSLRTADRHTDGMMLVGDAPAGPVSFLEHGLTFLADVVKGHKTGHFFDQRDNRRLVAGYCSGKKVLDVCSATGGFSVHAAATGATSVNAIDVSAAALSALEANMAANRHVTNVARCRLSTTWGDAFDALERLHSAGERFDVVIVDPPSMAANAAQVDRARHAYGRFAERAIALVEPGGIMFQASCTSRVTMDDLEAIVQRAARRSGARLEILRRTGHAVDHPITFPEGGYLKGLLLRVTQAPTR